MTNTASFGTTDILVTAGFLVALAAAALVLLYSRRGKAMRARIDQAQADQDRKFYESKGKVRRPPIGPLTP